MTGVPSSCPLRARLSCFPLDDTIRKLVVADIDAIESGLTTVGAPNAKGMEKARRAAERNSIEADVRLEFELSD